VFPLVKKKAQMSMFMLTGQWSEPITSAWIFASLTLPAMDGDTRT
jgi:hypothetical protein